MKSDAIRVVVRSRKIPVRVEKVTMASPNALDSTVTQAVRIVVYDYAFDAEQERVLSNARNLARLYGARLDVIDLGREGVARRVAKIILSAFSRATPSILAGGPDEGPAAQTDPSKLAPMVCRN